MDQLVTTRGRMTRGHLGVAVQELTPTLARGLGLSDMRGLVVADVSPDGPAANSGLRRGDVITASTANRWRTSATFAISRQRAAGHEGAADDCPRRARADGRCDHWCRSRADDGRGRSGRATGESRSFRCRRDAGAAATTGSAAGAPRRRGHSGLAGQPRRRGGNPSGGHHPGSEPAAGGIGPRLLASRRPGRRPGSRCGRQPRGSDDLRGDRARLMRIGRLRGWRARLRALTRAERRHVRDILGAHYTAKIRAARRFAEDADRLGRYPDRRERLLEIAAREENHARWLRQTIQRLGGRVPERVPSPPAARTTWERLVSDLEAEKDTLETLVDDAYAVQRDYPDVAALLLRIREEDTAHEREIASIIRPLRSHGPGPTLARRPGAARARRRRPHLRVLESPRRGRASRRELGSPSVLHPGVARELGPTR
jgi:rubrerythrin